MTKISSRVETGTIVLGRLLEFFMGQRPLLKPTIIGGLITSNIEITANKLKGCTPKDIANAVDLLTSYTKGSRRYLGGPRWQCELPHDG
jgi:hypothetical protein